MNNCALKKLRFLNFTLDLLQETFVCFAVETHITTIVVQIVDLVLINNR